MIDSTNTSTVDTEASAPVDYTQAEPGAIDKSRSCGNCAHLKWDVDADDHPDGVCGRHGWGLADHGIARCTSHVSEGERAIGLHRPAKAINAPTECGASAAYLQAQADVFRLMDEGAEVPERSEALCHLIEEAPQSFFDHLEGQQAGAAAAWKQWAIDHRAWLQDQQDRLDYPDFFAALAELREIIDQHGEDAAHEPEHVGIFIRLFESAPPRDRAVAEEILAPAIPTPTHVNDAGEPVFSLDQLAQHLDVPVDELQALADEHLDPAAMYRGAAHPIQ